LRKLIEVGLLAGWRRKRLFQIFLCAPFFVIFLHKLLCIVIISFFIISHFLWSPLEGVRSYGKESCTFALIYIYGYGVFPASMDIYIFLSLYFVFFWRGMHAEVAISALFADFLNYKNIYNRCVCGNRTNSPSSPIIGKGTWWGTTSNETKVRTQRVRIEDRKRKDGKFKTPCINLWEMWSFYEGIDFKLVKLWNHFLGVPLLKKVMLLFKKKRRLNGRFQVIS